ncbi:MAG: SDR family oxidoreductase [Clostridia bacterium]|nr:SDR family oxidoreductase [Clostridia bacterium]
MGILNKFSLEGKVVLITGGAGKYGRQIVKAIAQAGAKTYVASRNLEKLEEVAAEERKDGYDVTALQYDQSSEESILALRDEIMKRSGRIDVLINNSVARPMKDWEDDAANFAKSMQVNATGLFIITRAFGDIMAKQGSGSIVNIGSMQGMIGPDATLYKGLDMNGFVPDYFFHKGGIINFSRFVASNYGPYNVRCNCISPGGFYTKATPDEFVRRYSDRTLIGRMANETDLMGIVVFLSSDASQYITGANIPVDGGYTAK